MIVTIAGSAFTFYPDDDELGGINLEFAAFDGEIGNGQFPVPDPAAAAAMVTGRQFAVEQDSALLTDGFVIDNDRQRGPFRVGSMREYGVSVQDANALLHGFRVTRDRPAETDYARVIAFAGLDGPSWLTTQVLNASTITMPAKRYDGDGGWDELISDVVEFTGKTLFLHDKADGSGRCLHYHLLTNGHACGLSISDVATAQDGVTVFAPQQPIRQRTSVDLSNDVKGRGPTGLTYTATDATSIATHDADGLQHQALVDFDATTLADLTAKTNAYLASSKDDYDTYTCTIGPLDDAALALIRVGDIITVTSAVMGLSASPQRIAHMMLKITSGNAPGLWNAELEMGAPVRRRARVKAAAAIAQAIVPVLPTRYICIPTDFTVPTCGGLDGHDLTTAPITGLEPGSFPGESTDTFKLYNNVTYRFHFTAHHATTNFECNLNGVVGGGWLPLDFQHEPPMPGPPAVYDLVVAATYPLGAGEGIGTCENFTIYQGAGYAGCNSIGSYGGVTVTYLSGADPRFDTLPPCSNSPTVGQTTEELGTVGDGVTTTGTTNYPYAPGSLRVTVGGVAVVPSETDPATGTYTLPVAPPVGVTPVVNYLVASAIYTGAANLIPLSVLEYIPDAFLASNTPLPGQVLTWNASTRTWETPSDFTMPPYFIDTTETFTVPLYKQVLFAETIDNLGTLDVLGHLIEVD
jgi:hypothetical protein